MRVDYRALSGTVRVAEGAARHNLRLRSVAFPEGLRAIEANAFFCCPNLILADLPETIESIGDSAFEGASLSSIRIPASLTRVGNVAFSTHATRRDDIPPSLTSIEVAPGNERFFMDGGMLCEHTDKGEIRVVLYAGKAESVVIPQSVTVIAPYAFARARGVRELTVHDRIRFIGSDGFAFDTPPLVVRIVFTTPFEGHDFVQVRLPDTGKAITGFLRAMHGPTLNPALICERCDAAMLRFGTLFERATSAIERLSDPVFLDPSLRTYYEDILGRRLEETCRTFAKRDFAEGFDALADLGYLNERTITGVIDAVNETGSVAMTGHVLELKRRRFGRLRDDYEL